MSEPDYLFDGSGPAPDDVRRLEELLGRFAHGRKQTAPPAMPPPARGLRVRWILAAAAAAVVLAAVVLRLLSGRSHSARTASGIAIVRADGAPVGIDEWIETRDETQHLSLSTVGWLTLAPGGRLHVRRLDDEQGRFYLERGSLEAFVFPQVKARFFQVDTPAATCVDLGCKYTLQVDPASKVAHVVVTMGQVAFVEDGREVFIPRGAECRAVPRVGAGTPRFTDCSEELRARLDAFDAAHEPERRRALAAEVAAAAAEPRDTLPLWHLYSSTDPQVRAAVEPALVRLGGEPAERTVEGFRDHLDRLWW